MLKKDLIKLKTVKISELNEIQDIGIININDEKTQPDRAVDFFKSINNPYILKSGDITMKINFNGEKSFSEVLASAIRYT